MEDVLEVEVLDIGEDSLERFPSPLVKRIPIIFPLQNQRPDISRQSSLLVSPDDGLAIVSSDDILGLVLMVLTADAPCSARQSATLKFDIGVRRRCCDEVDDFLYYFLREGRTPQGA